MVASRLATIALLALAAADCGGSPSTPAPPVTIVPLPAITFELTITPTGSSSLVRTSQCRAGLPCLFSLIVTAPATSVPPIRVTFTPGDGGETIEFDITDGASTRTWSRVYPAAGNYVCSLKFTTAPPASVPNLRMDASLIVV